MLLLLVFIFAVVEHLALVDADCELDPFNPTPTAIVINQGSSDFVYPPHGQTKLKFAPKAAVEFACPGGNAVISGISQPSVVKGTCDSKSTFLINGKKVEWKDIKCNKDPVSTAKYTGQKCPEGGKEAEIGFDLGNKRFLRVIRICFDDVAQNVVFANYKIPSSIGQKQTGTPRTGFVQAGFYTAKAVDDLYKRENQTNTINSLLGLSTADPKYIKKTGSYYLARGHMAAFAEFFYPYQQKATFYFINVAPKWQTLNNGNWKTAEADVTKYASSKGVDLEIWTGTFGTATLPHEKTKKPVPLYLYTQSQPFGIPVPEVAWKVVHNPKSKTGIALVGTNNPYQTNVKPFCKDQSGSLKWLTWKKDDIEKGYSFACTIPDFKKAVKNAPNLNVGGILQ